MSVKKLHCQDNPEAKVNQLCDGHSVASNIEWVWKTQPFYELGYTVTLVDCGYRKNTTYFPSAFRTCFNAWSYPTDETGFQAAVLVLS